MSQKLPGESFQATAQRGEPKRSPVDSLSGGDRVENLRRFKFRVLERRELLREGTAEICRGSLSTQNSIG